MTHMVISAETGEILFEGNAIETHEYIVNNELVFIPSARLYENCGFTDSNESHIWVK